VLRQEAIETLTKEMIQALSKHRGESGKVRFRVLTIVFLAKTTTEGFRFYGFVICLVGFSVTAAQISGTCISVLMSVAVCDFFSFG